MEPAHDGGTGSPERSSPEGRQQEMSMVSYKDIAREIALADGQEAVVTFDPAADVGVSTGSYGGTVYQFHVVLDGKPAVLKGGKRLFDAIADVVAVTAGPTKIRIKASGEPRSLTRTYKVVKA